MSKTRRKNTYVQDFYEDDEHYDIDYEEYRQHKKEKRIIRALKTRNLDELLYLEEDDY